MNPKWLCLLALFSTLYVLFQMAGALVQVFDAFDRKVFKNRKQRFATFDKQGILTLDGTVNGKSNDIVFPNGEDNFANQNLCNEPKLMFELCETNKFGPWTGLAICYESQLSQPYINPFFRIETLPTMKPMVKAICGERQSAIFINRVPKPKVVKRPSNSSILYDKYEPFYSIGASFTEDNNRWEWEVEMQR